MFSSFYFFTAIDIGNAGLDHPPLNQTGNKIIMYRLTWFKKILNKYILEEPAKEPTPTSPLRRMTYKIKISKYVFGLAFAP